MEQGTGQEQGSRVGRYVLLTRLATGGMAEVWLARATGASGFQKTVVLKTILPHLADNPDFIRMFINEALLAAVLDHPNIVHIFDLGQVGQAYYIAMEYISGRTLRQLQMELRKTRRVPPAWFVLYVVASVCDALDYAHNKCDDSGRPLGLVHRDVTPENIMVALTGDTKVLDFGIAKASTAASITRAGTLKGKYAYMAPEQISGAVQGSVADPRSDLYALGVVLYEFLTGVRPYRAPNEILLLREILEKTPEPPSKVAPWISKPLESIVNKAIAKNPRDRFQKANEFRAAIEEYLQSVNMHPTRRHVAEYISGLFTDQAAQSQQPVSSLSPGVSVTPASFQNPEDSSKGGEVDGPDSVPTIDVSMILDADGEFYDAGASAEQNQPPPVLSPKPVAAKAPVPEPVRTVRPPKGGVAPPANTAIPPQRQAPASAKSSPAQPQAKPSARVPQAAPKAPSAPTGSAPKQTESAATGVKAPAPIPTETTSSSKSAVERRLAEVFAETPLPAQPVSTAKPSAAAHSPAAASHTPAASASASTSASASASPAVTPARKPASGGAEVPVPRSTTTPAPNPRSAAEVAIPKPRPSVEVAVPKASTPSPVPGPKVSSSSVQVAIPKPSSASVVSVPKPSSAGATPKPSEVQVPKPAQPEAKGVSKPAASAAVPTPKPRVSGDVAIPKPRTSSEVTVPKPSSASADVAIPKAEAKTSSGIELSKSPKPPQEAVMPRPAAQSTAVVEVPRSSVAFVTTAQETPIPKPKAVGEEVLVPKPSARSAEVAVPRAKSGDVPVPHPSHPGRVVEHSVARAEPSTKAVEHPARAAEQSTAKAFEHPSRASEQSTAKAFEHPSRAAEPSTAKAFEHPSRASEQSTAKAFEHPSRAAEQSTAKAFEHPSRAAEQSTAKAFEHPSRASEGDSKKGSDSKPGGQFASAASAFDASRSAARRTLPSQPDLAIPQKPVVVREKASMEPTPTTRQQRSAEALRDASRAQRAETPPTSAWDTIMTRVREQKERTEEPAPVPEPTPSAPPEPVEEPDKGGAMDTAFHHDWEAVLRRIRHVSEADHVEESARESETPAEPSPTPARPIKRSFISEVQAMARFEEGLACMRKQDYEGALRAWTLALKLDPENRLYQSNMRKLKKLINDGGNQ